jgi:hypothetical protein
MRLTSLLASGMALGLALAPLASAHADAEPGSALVSYTLAANAPGLGLEGLYRDVALTVPETTSTLSTGGVGTGFAAVAWPGPIIGNGGTTLLVLNSNVPPQATLLNDPVRAESHSGGTEKASYGTAPGPVMTSTASRSAVSARSSTGAGTTLPIGSVGAVTGATTTTLTGAGRAVSTAASSVSDLSLADGVITVGSVVSTATTTTDGKVATATGRTELTGLTVAGVAVTVDGQHLQVAGTSVANPLAVDTLNAAVKALGLTVVVTDPHVVRTGGLASYDAGAVVLLFDQGASHVALTLGRASARVTATQLTSEPVLGGLPPLGAPTSPGTTVTPTGSAGSTSSTSSIGGPVSVDPLPSTAATTTPGVLPQVLATVLQPVAAVVALAGGAPTALVLLLLVGVSVLGFLLQRMPEPFLSAAAGDACEEQQG